MDTVNRSRRARAWLVYPLCLLLLSACQKSLDEKLADAKLQQEIGSWRDSIATLQEILNDQPDHPEANLLLGSAQITTGQPALAIWPLEVAARSPEYADAADLALGAAYLRLEQNDAALAAADRVLARDPQDPNVRQAAITIRAGGHLAAHDWDATLEDVDRLLAANPESAEALTIMAQALMGAERIDEAEATLRRIWDSPTMGRTAAAGRAGIALAKIQAYEREDLNAAQTFLEELLVRFPQDAHVIGFVTDFLYQNDRPDAASKLLRDALERDPGDLELRGQLAKLLVRQGNVEEAETLLVEATELFDSPQAWLTLSDHYGGQHRPKDALAAFERTLELLPGTSDLLQFRYADVLAAAGDLDRADSVAREIEGDAYRNVVQGRIAFLRGQYGEALQRFDAGLREWPNNAGARYLAGKSAMALGDVDRGIEEYREALRVGMDETEAGIALTMVYLDLGRPGAALSTVGVMLDDPEYRNSPRSGNAILLLARAHWLAGSKKNARDQIEQLAHMPGYETLALLEAARFDAEEDGPAAAARRLAGAGLDLADPENERVLRLACEHWIGAGEGNAALERARAAVAAHPEHAAFHDVLGRVLVMTGRGNEAVASFDRALELSPEYAPALEGLASLRFAGGDAQGARELFDRAAAADPGNTAYPYQAAEVALASGDLAAAEERLREVLRRNAVHAHAANNLAWILAERGESLDEALALATRASQADESASTLDTLGWVHYRRGEHAQAASVLERARALDATSPSIAYRLALALSRTGDTERAAELFRQALSGGPFPEAEAARTELARLERGAS